MTFNQKIICVVIMVLNHSAYCQQVKRLIGGYIDGKDTIVSIVKEYSPEGYLLEENQPGIYCYQSYRYDSIGRIRESDNICGESSSNGGKVYDYSKDKTCTHEYAADHTVTICDSFSMDGKLLLSKETFIDEIGSEGNRSNLTKYIRHKSRIIKKEERKIQYNLDSTKNDTSFLLTAYNYNDFDSLNSCFLINLKTNDTLEKWNIRYDSKSYRKIEEVRYALAERFKDSTIYRYDEKGRLIEKSSLGFSFTSSEPLTMTKIEHIFKKDQLVIVKDFYKSIAGSWEHVNYYKKGLLSKTNIFIDGKVAESIKYYYTFW